MRLYFRCFGIYTENTELEIWLWARCLPGGLVTLGDERLQGRNFKRNGKMKMLRERFEGNLRKSFVLGHV